SPFDLYNYDYIDNGHGPFSFIEKLVNHYCENHRDKVHKLLKEYICKFVVPEWLELNELTKERRKP
ncbi:unnamed protein product, partial [marine sediment metagenome]